MFMNVSGFECGGETVLLVIKFVMSLLGIVFFIIPMILIVLLIVDYVKAVVASDEEQMAKINSLALKRIIVSVMLFLVPYIVRLTVNIGTDNSIYAFSCIDLATTSTTEELAQYRIENIDSLQSVLSFFKSQSKYAGTEKDKDKYIEQKKAEAAKSKSITGTYDIKSKKNLVGIFYTTWHDVSVETNPSHQIITQTSNYKTGVFYYWGEPALGFYKSSDKSVIKKHMKQLNDAGVDFIIIDNTNVVPKWGSWKKYVTTPMTAILDTIVEMRKKGQKTPYVVNWVNTGHEFSGTNLRFTTWGAVEQIYNEFYTNKKYKDVWVYWDKKPFILTTSPPTSKTKLNIYTKSIWTTNINNKLVSDWSYLEGNNDVPAKDSKGNVEQIGVSAAVQQGYMSDGGPYGRKGGKTFYNQWKVAFKYRPKVVTITWWNEWTAQHQGGGRFVDEYNQEYSRDIEPMKGGHGDTYYKWMKDYIKAYKNEKKCPKNYNS